MSILHQLSSTVKKLSEDAGEKAIAQHMKELSQLQNNTFSKAIVVLTWWLEIINNQKNHTQKIVTDSVACIRESAAARLYHSMIDQWEKPVIITAWGNIYDESNTNTILSHVMKNELIKKYNISTENIITEDQSIDTSQNAKYSSMILRSLWISPTDTTLITNDFHLERSVNLFQKYFGAVEAKSAESILKNHSNHYKKIMEKWINSEKHKQLVSTDAKIRYIYKIPWWEKLIEALATFFRQKREGYNNLPVRKI